MPHSIQAGDYLHSTNYIPVPKLFTGLESIMGELYWSMGETKVERVRRARPPQKTKPRDGLDLVTVLKEL